VTEESAATGRVGASDLAPDPLLNVVLHRSEIPTNTGSIGRACVALACDLHLIHPVGFDLSVKACRRAGLDYWSRLRVLQHDDWASYAATVPRSRVWLFSARATTAVFDVPIQPGDHLVFGSESTGLPREVLAAWTDRAVCLPIVPGERSLNLASASCAAVYEGIRQFRARGLVRFDGSGRIVRALSGSSTDRGFRSPKTPCGLNSTPGGAVYHGEETQPRR